MSQINKKIRNLPRDPDVVCVNCGHPDAVWAHDPYHDAGMGQKCDDIFGAPLCNWCHDYRDGRQLTDRRGHSCIQGGQNDWEWRYRVLREGIKVLMDKNLLAVK